MEKIPIPSHYHDYASQSTSDITSNIGFICIGLYILYKQQKISLLVIHIICIGIFSGYYHLQPSKERIVYDMLAVITTHIIVLSYFLYSQSAPILKHRSRTITQTNHATRSGKCSPESI